MDFRTDMGETGNCVFENRELCFRDQRRKSEEYQELPIDPTVCGPFRMCGEVAGKIRHSLHFEQKG